jgi:hypothetical protein
MLWWEVVLGLECGAKTGVREREGEMSYEERQRTEYVLPCGCFYITPLQRRGLRW